MTNESVYIIDGEDSLYYVAWFDIVFECQILKSLLERKIKEFYVATNGISIKDKEGKLKIPHGTVDNLHKIPKVA